LELDLGDLELAASRVAELAPDLVEASEPQTVEALLEALRLRTRAEQLLAGAEALGLRTSLLTEDQEVELMTFDELVRPHLWELTALNEQRSAELQAVAPSQRSRLWWWSEGVTLPPDTAGWMSHVACLVRSFPDAREEFEQLIAADRLLDEAYQGAEPHRSVDGDSAKVVTLSSWIKRRQVPNQAGEELLLAAGFAGSESTLMRTPEAEVSWREPGELLLDLLVDRVEGQMPYLQLGHCEVQGAQVPDCEERFSFHLDAPELSSKTATLVLPLRSGLVRIELFGDS